MLPKKNSWRSLHWLILCIFVQWSITACFKHSVLDVIVQKGSNGEWKYHFFGQDYKRRTPFQKCVCERWRNKVLELYNAFLSAQKREFFWRAQRKPRISQWRLLLKTLIRCQLKLKWFLGIRTLLVILLRGS